MVDRRTFPRWYNQLQYHANTTQIWPYVDPEGSKRSEIYSSQLYNPTFEEFRTKYREQEDEAYAAVLKDWEKLPPEQKGNKPLQKTKSDSELDTEYERELKRLPLQQLERSQMSSKLATLREWINKSVGKAILANAQTKLVMEQDFTTRGLVKEIKLHYGPTETSIKTAVIQRYNEVLAQAEQGNVKPERWYYDWLEAFHDARIYKASEVEGVVAVKTFLKALNSKMANPWANTKLQEIIEKDTWGEEIRSLEHYGNLFHAMLEENRVSASAGGSGIFTTLGGNPPPPRNSSESRPRRSGDRRSGGHKCPCLPTYSAKHPHKPADCDTLKTAITGKPVGRVTSNMESDRRENILKKLEFPQYKDLRAQLTKQGLLDAAGKPKGASPQGLSRGQNISAAVIDPALLDQSVFGVYSTLSLGRHPFADSTLVDNCGATHLVNSRDLIVPGTYRRATDGETVEAGTTSFPVSGFGTRVIKSVLLDDFGERCIDLTLENVAVVEGFHLNIVSEARLRKKGIWYCGFDVSLRMGDMSNSYVIAKLESQSNLIFLEYKATTNYPSVPIEIPVSPAGIMMFPTLQPKQRPRAWKPSVDYLRPRKDSEELWHKRAGHLGPKALRALVKHARNVEIDGTARLKCEHCARAHATEVVSRRPSENRSPRPFWRIHWDWFDYPLGYNGTKWLLVIKDEYSGTLYGYPAVSKRGEVAIEILQNFESWVRREKRLYICRIKQDNDTGTIGITGFTKFQHWARTEGIKIETPPPYTKEPVGGGERAGGVLIPRCVAMMSGANLPQELWPEVAQHGAIWLHNMSPSPAHNFRSPNEVLESWFRDYFRWYSPEISKELTVDLRPDFGSTYAYGCRAYPLMKDREAHRDRRAFKVMPRAHIGYLVGYVATNLYRIWVPSLDKVITTRNVRFDEELFYKEETEAEEAIPIPVSTELAQVLHTSEEQAVKSYILDLLDAWDHKEKHTPLTSELVLQDQEDLDPLEGQLGSLDSGVEKLTLVEDQGAIGLQTPRETPAPDGEEQAAPTASEELGADPLPQSADLTSGEGILESTEMDGSHEAGDGLSTRQTAEVEGPASDEEEDIGDTIVVAGDATSAAERSPARNRGRGGRPRATRAAQTTTEGARRRPRIDYGPATRRSTRLRSSQAEAGPSESHQTEQGNYAVSGSVAREAGEARQVRFVDICGGVTTPGTADEKERELPPDFPTLEDALRRTGEELTTFHAVIAAAIFQKHATRLSAAPSKGRLHRDELLRPPKMWRDLANHPLGKNFSEDAHSEMRSMIDKGVFREIDRLRTKNRPIPLKWVFDYKFDEDGYLERCKSRLVVRGDLQEEDSLTTTYAATLAARTFRAAMAIAAEFDLEVDQYDVKTAFLNAVRDENVPVTCEYPDGFKKPGTLLEVKRALYGLRDSPLLWYREFKSTLLKAGLIPSTEEPCLFYNEQRTVLLVFFVDDILVLYNKKHKAEAQKLERHLKSVYELKDQGPVSWFLGIKVIRDREARKIYLSHDSYIEKIAARFGLANNAWRATIPLGLDPLEKNSGQASKQEIKDYQERVGSILYTAIMIRPDVAFAASSLSRFLTNPSPEHLKAADKVIKYLYATRYLGIAYGGGPKEAQALLIAGDASFADDEETRRSSQGYLMSLFGGPIAWRAARQDTVTTSTTEAETLALEHTAKETIALKRLFRDFQLELGDVWKIFCDNQQTIRLVVEQTERISTKLRHVDIQNMWLKQEQEKGTFQVTYLPTDQMPADGLTKALSRQKFEHFRALLNLQDTRQITSEDTE